ncbi:putative disease resistance protein RGA3 [Vitis vinifera]|uniref:Putative disease resistance protein RGA3 n=1 Tax=Vitis vinifera TaxID=29760 RepID=A0A438FXE1_VITVI|nr:putative disease resistance protein RGA3 [Vitis vinifera]
MIKALKGKPIRTFFGEEKVPKCLGKLSHLSLKRIPDNIGELINLRHLENDEWWLRNHKIGSLSELKGLNQLRGGLCISNLQNVRDVELVSRGEILKGKQYLQSLRLKWERSGQDGGDEGDKSVMEGLQPHPHLKDIFIEGYGGTEFPSWMMNDGLGSLLPHLIEIEVSGCSRCKILPPFSQLPSLKSLKLDDMKEVVELNEGSSATPFFPSLESLELSNMLKLKELWRMDLLAEQRPSFSHLSQLEIRNCHNLASLELHSSPHLSQLEINDCPNLTSIELPSSLCLSQLDIKKCPNLASFKVASLPSLETLSLFTVRYGVIWQIMSVSASSSLKSLYIESINDMISLPKELLQHVSGLVTLQIRECPNLQSLELPLSPCPSQLKIGKCPNLASFNVASLPRLEKLVLRGVRAELLQHVSGLVTLAILECPNLQSLELPSSPCLSQLKIGKCPNLASFNVASLPRLEKLVLRGVRAEVLRQLMFVSASSLKSLRIQEIDCMISLSEEPLQYVSTLETLSIVKCSGLATLLHWMGSLSSLTELIIYDCSELTSLPEEIYSLKKLQTFYFCDYPHLEERYKKETGEDRAKIAHIPHVRFKLISL